MKKNLWKKLLFGCLVICLLTGNVLAVTDTVKTLQAHYSGINLVINGVQVTPKDADGLVVEPFIVDGTTYLPVRAIANALGEEVDWDGSTRTVYIGEIPGKEVNWMQKLPPYMTGHATVYDGSDLSKFFTVAGTKQTKGIEFQGVRSSYVGDPYDGYAIWNVNGLYKSMTFTVCSIAKHNVTLEVNLNGEYVTEYEIKWDDPPKTITVPLNYAASAKINLHNPDMDGTSFGMYDISFAE